MKRSEFITNVTNSVNYTLTQPADLEALEEAVNHWLTVFEQAGMLPPVKKRCPVLLTDVYKWEPENG